MNKPKYTFVRLDDWSRRLFKSQKTGNVYVEVDGYLYDMTDEGEPISPIINMDDIEVVSKCCEQ